MSLRDNLHKLPRGFRWIRFDLMRGTVILYCDRGLWTQAPLSFVTSGDRSKQYETTAICAAMLASGQRGWVRATGRWVPVNGQQHHSLVVSLEPVERPAHMYHRYDPREERAA
jgi:hypothetical protein